VHLFGEQFIFFGAILVVLSILAGMLSNRIGAPLLLVFLGLGMLAGEDGPGGVQFSDFTAAYLLGSVALAVILFDGGLRTPMRTFRLALWPSMSLATVGVVATAVITGLAAALLFDFGWLGGMLIGATVASTDAAAVFLLLHSRGTRIEERVSATLEVESGINDPMAVFLTVLFAELLQAGGEIPGLGIASSFIIQMVGGTLIGIVGGLALAWLVNRVEIATGLYPILVVAGAITIFGGTHLSGGSGFVAVYVAGFVFGNRKHRAARAINRFHDGLAWMCQIGLFLMLGLLITPSTMVQDLVPGLLIAAVLIFVARPLAVWVCLLPFRFAWREVAFISWVGLRGAVPIFLATVPVLAGVPGGTTYFSVAFVVVLASLVLQGWTLNFSARLLRLVLPAASEEANRFDIDVPTGTDREIAGYRIAPDSAALSYPYPAIPLPRRTRILTVIREGTVMDRSKLPSLSVGDYVLALAPPEQLHALDALFASRRTDEEEGALRERQFGDFTLGADAPAGMIADLYGVPVDPEERNLPLDAFLKRRLPARPVVGDWVRVGDVELVVTELANDAIAKVGVALEPEARKLTFGRARQRLSEEIGVTLRRLGKRMRRGEVR
jgi:cell volume regulation protein A